MPLTVLHAAPNLPPFDPSQPPPAPPAISGHAPPLQVRHVQSDVCVRWKGAPAIVDLFALPENTPSLPGTLSISTDQLYWYCSEIGKGFALDYPSIQLHALSRKTPELAANLYLQVDMKSWVTADGTLANTMDQEEEEETITELLLFPEDEGSVDILFEAFCECANLHPDAMSDDENDTSNQVNGYGGDEGGDSDGDADNAHKEDKDTRTKRARLEDLAGDAMARFHDAEGPLH